MALIKKLKTVLKIPQQYAPQMAGHKPRKEGEIVKYLWKWNPKLDCDEENNLFILNPGTPLICVHMDTVQNYDDTKGIEINGLSIKDGVIRNGSPDGGILGADDRCGVALAMQLYETYGDNISILFTTGEETGMPGSRLFLKQNKEFLEGTPYCLVLDRMGAGDIIGFNNRYCSQEFQDAAHEHLKLFGYAPANGIGSDANILSAAVNCLNLSIGYYDHHHKTEHIKIDETLNAFKAICYLLENLEGDFPIYKYKPVNNWNQYNQNTTYKQSKKQKKKYKKQESIRGDQDDYGGYENYAYGEGYNEFGDKIKSNEKDVMSSNDNHVGELFTVNGKTSEIIIHEETSFYNSVTGKTITLWPGIYLFFKEEGWNG